MSLGKGDDSGNRENRETLRGLKTDWIGEEAKEKQVSEITPNL